MNRAAVRLVFILVTAALAIAITAPDIIVPWHPWATLGFQTNPRAVITQIFPAGPAERAGLQVGDAILDASGPFAMRSVKASYSVSAAGRVVHLTVRDRYGRVRRIALTAAPFPRTLLDNVTDVLSIVSYVLFILIAATLLMLRPSLSSWAFYVYAAGQMSLATVVGAYCPDVLYTAARIYYGAGLTVSPFALVVFALSFPNNAIDSWRRQVLAVCAGATALSLLGGFARAWFTANGGFLPGHQSFFTASVDISFLISALMILTVAGAFIASYATALAPERMRLRWVILGAIVGIGGKFAIGLLQTLPALSISPPVWAYNTFVSLNVLFPIAVAYALLTQRLIEVRFFLSRALVYSLVTTLAVIALALVEFVVSQSVAATRLGVVVEIGGAVAIGLGISRLHQWIDRLVERYVFRSVYEAERHLGRIADALMFAHSTQAIDGMLVQEAKEALRLDRVSVIREFDPDEPLPLRLLAGREAIDHGDTLAVPLLVRNNLFGDVLFGHHTNGAAIDPNERAILNKLTRSAALAYDHLASEERRAENDQLRLENGVLRSLIPSQQTGHSAP